MLTFLDHNSRYLTSLQWVLYLNRKWGVGMGVEWTVRKILDWTKGYFRKAGVGNSRLTAEKLLAHSLDVDRLKLYLYPDRPVSKKERATFKELILKRKRGVPTQYLIGEVSFMGCDLKVDERSLIPRPETEEMVDRVITKNREKEDLHILDLGTGSGAIAIALAKFLNSSRVVASDITKEALDLAKENAKRNMVHDRIEFLLSDWFSKVKGNFDLIVTNPPYVNHKDLNKLPQEVKNNEPIRAVDGGAKGLEEIRKILEKADDYLKEEGELWMEIGRKQAKEISQIIEGTQLGNHFKFVRDLGGKYRILTTDAKVN